MQPPLLRRTMPSRRDFSIRTAAAALLWMGLFGTSAAEASCVTPPLVAAHPALTLESVARDVWWVPVANAESNAANGGWVTQPVLVRDGRRLWLIGSGPTPAQGQRMRCAIERQLHRRVTDIVNTRAHPELALANVAFPGARVWALGDVAHAMKQRCPQCLTRLQQRIAPTVGDPAGDDSLRDAAIRVASHRFGRGPASAAPDNVSGRTGPFGWWAFERAPGQRTLVLLHRASGWIVAQGLVWVGGVPNLRETELDPLMDSLRRLRALSRSGGGGLLGEQGGPGALTEIDRHLDYLTQLRQRTQAALDRGEVEGATPIELPDFADTPGYAAYHALNRQRVWRELEQAWFK